ncbi:MAG TPA: PAS domain-containing protein, partial [Phenylobacterium sp.]|nr:PAS domain-containing protein [Phenylobacterium sp.]
MPITPVEWPLRFIPRQPPQFLNALAVSLASAGAAIGVQGAFLGWPGATGFSSTFFPAFIFATLYGGSRWGWATLAFSMLLGVATPRAGPLDGAAEARIAMFAISGAATVLVASVLRRTLLRLEEARRIQQEIQDALDRSEARLTLAQDAGGVGLWDWDVVTGASHWSPTLYRNLGLPLDAEASMGTLLEAVHPEDRQAVLAANADAVNTGHFQAMEYRVVWPDGSTHWLLSRGEMLRDPETGAVTQAAGVNIDVTDRRVAFEQVRESESRFRAMADSAPVLMWVSKIDGSREFANQAYVNFLGVPYEEAITFDWRKRLAEEDIPRILREQLTGEASRELFALEARYLRCDGEWRWMRSFSQPRYGPAGEFTGFIGIGFDVTDAKRAEADLKQINELLTERVQAALAERDQAEAALRHGQKLEAVGQLTGGVAHDFNNLLTVVIGALDLIQRHPNDADRRDRMIEAALGAARRGERLTHQLLA